LGINSAKNSAIDLKIGFGYLMDTALLINFFIALLAILNPIGNLPIFIADTAKYPEGVRRAMAVLLSVVIFLLLIGTLFLGNHILDLFGISIPAFRIAGGIVILIVGLGMVYGKATEPIISQHIQETSNGNDFQLAEARMKLNEILVPLGVPIFVGPGTMSTVILYANKTGDGMDYILLCAMILVVSLVTCIILLTSGLIRRSIGDDGLKIATRILGLMLVAIAVQFFLDGLAQCTIGIINPQFANA
jgi:multiple antibiotic resistance protein